MFPRMKNQREERSLRLQRDLKQMENLLKSIPGKVKIVAKGNDLSAPETYSVEININSITKITELGTPIWTDKFKMDISLPIGYPTSQYPEIKIYPPPFHPHFSIRKRLLGTEYGLWVDPNPRPKNDDLGNVILCLLRSLRFEAEFIETRSNRIANRKALEWYSYWSSSFERGIEPWFPSDKTNLPFSLSSETSKKFDVESKHFSFREAEGELAKKKFAVAERKSFEILESTPAYTPTKAFIPDTKRYMPSDFRNGSESHHLYITRKAGEKIFRHISWDKITSTNKVEQGGILLGYPHYDETRNITWGMIEDAIPGETAVGTSAYLDMNHETWKKMIDQADTLLDSNLEKGLQILGWYHTHPNQLDVFMSGTDRGTQARVFSNDWQFAIVLNPHKKIWRAFHGENAEECLGFFV
jgi:proteasome lid subunit RPN8/RPN11